MKVRICLLFPYLTCSLEEVVSHNTSTAKNHYWLARILWSKLAEDKSLRSKFINTMLQVYIDFRYALVLVCYVITMIQSDAQ